MTNRSPRFSGRNSSQPCLCSPSARGHPPLSDKGIQAHIALLRDFGTLEPGSPRKAILVRKLQTSDRGIIARFSREGYVNLDAALRTVVPKTKCAYDRKTGRNLFPVKLTPDGLLMISLRSCDNFREYASSAARRRKFVPSPGPAPVSPAGAKDRVVPSPDSRLPLTGTDETNLGPSPTPEAASPSRSSATPTPRAPVAGTFSPPASPRSVNEGCVAIEHLHGCAVQHRVHLQRAVLCSRGFCATPNHAIIVDGIWTSMRSLCSNGWKCTEDLRLVNNLKISEATRLRIDDHIVVTPYDARFPVVIPWIVQIAEDIVAIVMLSLKVAALFAGALCANSVVHGHQREKKTIESKSEMLAPRTPGGPCATAICSAFPAQDVHQRLVLCC